MPAEKERSEFVFALKTEFNWCVVIGQKKLTSSKAQWSITRVMKVEKQFEAIKKQKRTSTIQLLYLLCVYFAVAVV